jgi:16S rRNA (uracil1498-N3)-methyltransferase
LNYVLLEHEDFVSENRVRLEGRRLRHVLEVLGSTSGDELRVGVIGGRTGRGRVEHVGGDALLMDVRLENEPLEPLPVRLILALPRPKVLNRTIAAAASMGIREIDLINSWRVEKSYWKSPRLTADNLRMQSILGLEQSGDTILPTIRLHSLFVPFVRKELSGEIADKLALLAHPRGTIAVPRNVDQPVVLAIGPEGGFIERESETFQEIGFTAVSLGPRILRVETVIACLIGRLI